MVYSVDCATEGRRGSVTGGGNSVNNSGSNSGVNCGELLLACYSRDVRQLPADLFTAAGVAGIAGGSCGRSCLLLPSRPGKCCSPFRSRPGKCCSPFPSRAGKCCSPFPSRAGKCCSPRPSRSPQPFRRLDRTPAAGLLALPLRASIGSSRLFPLSPWLPAAFSQGSFLHNHDQPHPRNLRGRVPSSTAARRHASTVSRFA